MLQFVYGQTVTTIWHAGDELIHKVPALFVDSLWPHILFSDRRHMHWVALGTCFFTIRDFRERNVLQTYRQIELNLRFSPNGRCESILCIYIFRFPASFHLTHASQYCVIFQSDGAKMKSIWFSQIEHQKGVVRYSIMMLMKFSDLSQSDCSNWVMWCHGMHVPDLGGTGV